MDTNLCVSRLIDGLPSAFDDRGMRAAFALLLVACTHKISFDPGSDGGTNGGDGGGADGSTLPGADAGSSGAFTTATVPCPPVDGGSGQWVDLAAPNKKAIDLAGTTALHHFPTDTRLYGPVPVRLADGVISVFCASTADYAVVAIPK